MPAKDEQGRPVLAMVAVVNYGDVVVQCNPSVPKAELQTIPTVIVEVSIQKSNVVDWDSTRNPLDYLGVHLREIRKNQVISSWSFKPFGSNRSPCPHDKASYIHGYIRIPETQLVSTLLRSGQAGIYLQPKSSDKKPDPRFGVVAVHGSKLDDVLRSASSIKEALGVVQLGRDGSYTIRARREHLSVVRQHILPQSICVQEGTVPTGATWWALRNLHASTTCTELESSLKKLGWNASVIRPSGKASWIVCATEGPPACHLCLGDDYVSVIPLLKSQPPSQVQMQHSNAPVPMPLQQDASMCPEEDGTSTTATRLSDMKSELEDHLVGLINRKMSACDDKINAVTADVQAVRGELAVVSDQAQRGQEAKEQNQTIQNQLQANQAEKSWLRCRSPCSNRCNKT